MVVIAKLVITCHIIGAVGDIGATHGWEATVLTQDSVIRDLATEDLVMEALDIQALGLVSVIRFSVDTAGRSTEAMEATEGTAATDGVHLFTAATVG